MALSNSVILSHIYQFLPLREKKCFREVAPLWEEVTINDWRNNVVVNVTGNSNDEPMSEGVTMPELVRTLQRFPEKPFRRFRLTDYDFNITHLHTPAVVGPEDEGTWSTRMFLEQYGPTTEYLAITDAKVQGGTKEDLLKWILLHAFPNLKGLTVDGIYAMDWDAVPRCKDNEFCQPKATKLRMLSWSDYILSTDSSMDEIFELIPNIKDLRLSRWGMAYSDIPSLNSLRRPLSNGKWIMLECLELNMSNWSGDGETELKLQLLREYVEEAKPPLKRIRLYLSLEQIKRSSHLLKMILEGCGKSLTWLAIQTEGFLRDTGGHSFSVTAPIPGLSLPELTHFYLKHSVPDFYGENYYDDDNHADWQSKFHFDPLQRFPKLKKLNVLLWCYNGRLTGTNSMERFLKCDATSEGLGKNSSLEEFNCHTYGLKFDGGSIKKLGSWMPSLKSLTIEADETIFPVVYDALPHLNQLNILPSTVRFRWNSDELNRTIEQENNNIRATPINIIDWGVSCKWSAPPDDFYTL